LAVNRFDVRITGDESEVREAQKLRFQIFNLEMLKGLQSSVEKELDVDPYDAFCDHIIVRDLAGGNVVGTYRLLLGSRAPRSLGFYSESEFDLKNIRKQEGELLELGRSCVHKNYRQSTIMDLMWQTIAAYVRSHRVRYVFGCASLPTMEPEEVSRCFALLKQTHYAPETLRVYPLPANSFSSLDDNARVNNPRAVSARVPRLIQGYLKVGAMLCGPPALDFAFGVTDLFLLLDTLKLSHEARRHFGFSV
jgi:putative hemolysin